MHRLRRFFRELRTGAVSAVHPFDLAHGTETSGVVSPSALDLPCDRAAHAVRYQSAIVGVFESILGELPIQHEQFVFVDLGSGKGRALLLASRFPFREIIGVELSQTLHTIACRNIEKYKDESQRCHRIRSVFADAGKFELPLDNLVFYLFNPFDDLVMREFAANVEASLREHPRQIYVIYLKSVHRHVWDRMASLIPFKDTANYVIFQTRPAGS